MKAKNFDKKFDEGEDITALVNKSHACRLNEVGNKRLLYWLSVFIWLEVIFLLSSIPGAVLPKMPSDDWQFWAHRSAHIMEYSVLGILVLRAYSYKKARIGVLTILFLSVFIFLAGAFDEWHQTFVPGRNGQERD